LPRGKYFVRSVSAVEAVGTQFLSADFLLLADLGSAGVTDRRTPNSVESDIKTVNVNNLRDQDSSGEMGVHHYQGVNFVSPVQWLNEAVAVIAFKDPFYVRITYALYDLKTELDAQFGFSISFVCT
jgi:hypothetical protein